MANEIQVAHSTSGHTLYALVRNTAGEVYVPMMFSFSTYFSGSLSSYAVMMSEQGTASRYYVGSMPTVAAGVYFVAVYQRVGMSPSETDPLVGTQFLDWNGSALIPANSILARLPASLSDGLMASKVVAFQQESLVEETFHPDTLHRVADQILDRAAGVESTVTLRQALRLIVAVCAGKISGAEGPTVNIRDLSDTKNRISTQVDAAGNRTAVMLDLS